MCCLLRSVIAVWSLLPLLQSRCNSALSYSPHVLCSQTSPEAWCIHTPSHTERGVCMAHSHTGGTPSSKHLAVQVLPLTACHCFGTQGVFTTTQQLEQEIWDVASSLVGKLEPWRERSAAAQAAAGVLRHLVAARLNRRVMTPRLVAPL
jgi:hypothetical protein